MDAQQGDDRFFRWGLWPIGIGAVGFGLWLAALALYPPLDEAALNIIAAGLGTAAASLYSYLAFRAMAGQRSRVARTGVVACLAAGGWILLTMGVLPLANGLLSRGPEQKVRAEVVELHYTPAKRDNSSLAVKMVLSQSTRRRWLGKHDRLAKYELVVAMADGQRTFRVSPNEFSAVDSGQATHMEITLRKGLLGFPWVVSAKVP